MVKKIRVLFVCTGNSARSQIAEGFARHYGGRRFGVSSAGTHPKGVHPCAVKVMKEVTIDISEQISEALATKDLTDYDYLVTLCGDARDFCPPLPPQVRSEHWPVADPAAANHTFPELLTNFRSIRNQIEVRVKEWLARILVH